MAKGNPKKRPNEEQAPEEDAFPRGGGESKRPKVDDEDIFSVQRKRGKTGTDTFEVSRRRRCAPILPQSAAGRKRALSVRSCPWRPPLVAC